MIGVQEDKREMEHSFRLLAANATPDGSEQLPVGFRAQPASNHRFVYGGQAAASPAVTVSQAAMSGLAEPAMTERNVKVDPDVAYESGLCTRCEPTKPQPWESGALWWMQVAFAALVLVIIGLLIAAAALCIKYSQQFGGCCQPPCPPKKRRCCK